jgi:DNA-binding NarL/FixJ family response regulator
VVNRLVSRRRRADPVETLSAREREVLELMAEGRSNRAIGERLCLSPKTVEAHVSTIFSKLGIEGTADDNRRVLSVLTWLRGDSGPA